MPKLSPYAAPGVYDPPIYAQALTAEDARTLVFIAGQVDYDANGGCAHPGDFKAQAHAALAALKSQIEAGGGTLANVVKVTTYITDMRYRADYGPIRTEFFGPKMPPHTLIGVASLAAPEYLIEIEAIAVL
ncbi:RidA family protein [Rhodopila sp.]|uniref:RidA family protein n=1 Tax=Rhodopila sp. TaxID=2480087 RepID=UPI003D0ECF2F